MGRGPLPRFTEVHVRAALELIHRRGRVGRPERGRKLGLGEGSARSLLRLLRRRGLVRPSRGGHVLTEKGREVMGEPLQLVRLNCGKLTVGKVDVAVLVRGAAEKVRGGVEERDEAIKVGAKGATVLVFREGGLRFPDSGRRVGGKVGKKLVEELKPSEGDVVILGTGENEVEAELGARAAAMRLERRRGRLTSSASRT
jgi:predicted transcriptional regulator